VSLPDELVELAFIDRTKTRAGHTSLQGAVVRLSEMTSFSTIDPSLSQEEYVAAHRLVGEQLEPTVAQEVCEGVQADGILSLEMLKVSSRRDYVVWQDRGRIVTTVSPGHERVSYRWIEWETEIGIEEDVFLMSEWRIYSCGGDSLDVSRFIVAAFSSGMTLSEAERGLSAGSEVILRQAFRHGQSVAERLLPGTVRELRTIYSGLSGSDLEGGCLALEAGDVDLAKVVWRNAAKSRKSSTRQKALLNLSVAAEVSGQRESALSFAREAHVERPSGAAGSTG